ncbi:hydrogenase assembly protein HupF [Anaerosporomusa subterranea]|uniref:Hydrogenase assembly protein HupF n=1 Tax=Anaerosporomusa subterranea TaxID=1794912 RepID=A0A154BUC4_ANASB|nr:[Fe-Fe] hydrogenase large subunit C-terminal domain-containing protein [Anaerosporomusa subterranea]KYZ77586.1 hydrogenase assembly protein HupF [Anaerosporomusa subterranea]
MKTISTQKVNCKDCHRCVRACPVKAIAIKKGHAQLVDDKCVLCGKCVVECPQNAKQVDDQTSIVREALTSNRQVIMSLAPSFVSAFPGFSSEEIIGMIRSLGFRIIEETAIGAEIVADFYRTHVEKTEQTVISACCPAIVNLITKYYPDLSKNLSPVVSPMLAHGRLLKSRYGQDCFVVFAGPCIAKIAEAEADGRAIDAVITFNQLRTMLDEVKSQLAPEEAGYLEDKAAFERARLFPLAGGILQSAFGEDDTELDLISVDGLRQCMLVFDSLAKGEIQPRFIEALACIGGCINGPAGDSSQSLPAKRRLVTRYAATGKRRRNQVPDISFNCEHLPAPITRALPTEQEIREILRQTGKYSKTDEKNCGACGYNSCRDNAVAVFQGLTETDTCVPYMRTKAESFANIVVDNSLNAIIVLDERLIIQEFNPSAERMFNRRHELTKGLSLTEVMDCTDILSAIQECRKVSGQRVEFPEFSLVTEKMIVPVPEHRLTFLIFSDVTEQERRSHELERMKIDTIDKAKEIINKQMHVAQEIAGLLGETTAETKSTLLELIAIMREKEGR